MHCVKAACDGSVALGRCVTVQGVCIAGLSVWALTFGIQLLALDTVRRAACLCMCALSRLPTGAAVCRHASAPPAKHNIQTESHMAFTAMIPAGCCIIAGGLPIAQVHACPT